MPASIFATTYSFLLLLGNSHVLSDTSSTSIVLKIKSNMRYRPFGYIMFIKRRKWHQHSLYSLGVKSLSHPQPSQGKGFIYFIYLLPQVFSVSKGNILLLSKDPL